MRGLESGYVRMEGEVKRKTDSTLLPLQMKEGSISQRIQAVSRNWKLDSPQGLQSKSRTSHTLV